MKKSGLSTPRDSAATSSPIVPSNSAAKAAIVDKELSDPILFAYNDHNVLQCELSEFYSYAEMDEETPSRSAFRRLFREVAGDVGWLTAPKTLQVDFFRICLDHFEEANYEKRVQWVYALLYVSEGLRDDIQDRSERLRIAREANILLKQVGALPLFIQALALYQSCQTDEDDSGRPSHPILRAVLNLLYLLIQFNKDDEEFRSELSRPYIGRKTLIISLFGFISDFNEKLGKTYPIKKILLLIWKVMCATLGTMRELKEEKNKLYKKAGYPSPEENIFFAKTKTVHVAQFQQELSKQYGTSDLDRVVDVPNPVDERQRVLLQHQLPSYWELKSKELATTLGYDGDQTKAIPRILIPDPCPVEDLYRAMLPNMSRYIIILLKILLAASPTIKNYDGAIVLDGEMKPTGFEFYESDFARHKEIIVHAISAILLLLLKHFRSNHILQFQHIGILLSDSNCILLILKFFNQDIPAYCLTYSEEDTFLMYDRFDPEAKKCNWRNTFASINFLRILQKLTKHHATRIRVLLQYKGPVRSRCTEFIRPSFLSRSYPPNILASDRTNQPGFYHWSQFQHIAGHPKEGFQIKPRPSAILYPEAHKGTNKISRPQVETW
eukprot:TRINITY_DN867_c0_g2_i1.p1 TRINITY_DN867_c0_g2~~TRINITY_DN867_c0_g2_i1.p1  ORF type:complete len:610 (+),score=99.47 TRINITY_DN867_c0_g2_i1:67-1896(+)